MFSGPARIAFVCVGAVGLICSLIAFAAADDRAPQPKARALGAPRVPPAASKGPPVDALLALSRARREADRLVANDDAGRRIELSIAPELQSHVQRILADYQVPYAALVAVEPSTGRILAYVSHSSANPQTPDLARDATPPAASVFKLVTAAALLDASVDVDARVCYGGGLSRLDLIDLQDDPRRDRSCASLPDAIGSSINAVVAKLADRHLDATSLRRYAGLFGFGQRLAFSAELAPSPVDIPEERLEFARTAAGFWHVHMSPLHAALLAAMLANDGVMPALSLVDRVLSADGRVQALASNEAPHRALSAATAHRVGRMMLRTVERGTARNAFVDARGRPLLPGIAVAGKTGSLSASDPYRAYSWWVGFAPADEPKIALAALIVNTPNWRIKSSFLAREALHEYLLPSHASRAPTTRPSTVFARCAGAETCGPAPVQTR